MAVAAVVVMDGAAEEEAGADSVEEEEEEAEGTAVDERTDGNYVVWTCYIVLINIIIFDMSM